MARGREPAETWSATPSRATATSPAERSRVARRLSPRDCAFRPLLARFSFGLGLQVLYYSQHEESVASLSLLNKIHDSLLPVPF